MSAIDADTAVDGKAAGKAAKKAARPRGAQNAYARFMSWLSVKHPALWRMRVDMLALFAVLNVAALVLVPTLLHWSVSDVFETRRDDEYYRLAGVCLVVIVSVNLLFSVAWVFALSQPMRLRQVTRFQNRPTFLVLLLALGCLACAPALTSLSLAAFTPREAYAADFLDPGRTIEYTGPMDDPALPPVYAGTAYPAEASFWSRAQIIFPLEVLALALLFAFCLAVFIKTVLLSSYTRALLAMVFAVGIVVALYAMGAAWVFGTLAYNMFSSRDMTSGATSLGLLVTMPVALFAVGFASTRVFRARAKIWRASLELLGIALAVFCASFAVTYGFHIMTDSTKLYDTMSSAMSGPFFAIAGPIFIFGALIAAYLLPHVMAIGGDLRRGARSRFTRLVVLSCFWSAPIALAGGAILIVANGTSYRPVNNLTQSGITRRWPEALDTVIYIAAAILTIIAVELLTRLARRIASLPEP